MHVLSINNSEEEKLLRSLSKKVTEQDFKDGTVQEIIDKLYKTLEHYGNGVGLSAIQLGYPLQIFVINCRSTEAFPSMKEFQKIIINPAITKYSEEGFDGREGCMSIADEECKPTQRYQVRRSVSVTFDYTDENNIVHKNISLSGIAAVVFQHEYDHLYGKLIDESSLPGKIISPTEYLERKNSGEKMVLF